MRLDRPPPPPDLPRLRSQRRGGGRASSSSGRRRSRPRPASRRSTTRSSSSASAPTTPTPRSELLYVRLCRALRGNCARCLDNATVARGAQAAAVTGPVKSATGLLAPGARMTMSGKGRARLFRIFATAVLCAGLAATYAAASPGSSAAVRTAAVSAAPTFSLGYPATQQTEPDSQASLQMPYSEPDKGATIAFTCDRPAAGLVDRPGHRPDLGDDRLDDRQLHRDGQRDGLDRRVVHPLCSPGRCGTRSRVTAPAARAELRRKAGRRVRHRRRLRGRCHGDPQRCEPPARAVDRPGDRRHLRNPRLAERGIRDRDRDRRRRDRPGPSTSGGSSAASCPSAWSPPRRPSSGSWPTRRSRCTDNAWPTTTSATARSAYATVSTSGGLETR